MLGASALFGSARAENCPLKRDATGQVAEIEIDVLPDSSYVWNGKKLESVAALDHCFELIYALSPPPKFRVNRDPRAPLMSEVVVMKSAQRARVYSQGPKP